MPDVIDMLQALPHAVTPGPACRISPRPMSHAGTGPCGSAAAGASPVRPGPGPGR